MVTKLITMKHPLKIVFIPFLLLVHVLVVAQAKNGPAVILHSGIKVIAKAYGDSIVLRWAPTRPWAWHKLNFLGYRIERIDISEKDNAKMQVLTALPLKPYPLEKFKTAFKPENSHAAIAAQCLYGKNFETNLRKGQAAIADKAAVSDARYAYTLMVADYDANVGVATALRFTDKNITKGGKYIYRIMPAAMTSQGAIDTGMVLVINNKAETANKPEITEGVALDHLSELHWDRNGRETWSGFYIERSEDGKTFNALNSLPYISSPPDSAALKGDTSKAKLFALLRTQHIYIDSLPLNYKNYYYRIKGINAFAEISGTSNTVVVTGKDLTAPIAVNMLNPKFISDRKIKVLWTKSTIEPDCKGYYITRAKNINGPYETLNNNLLPVGATEFLDENAYTHGGNFYMVIVVDTANNIASSVPAMGLVPDNTAPAAPKGVKGRIDKNGLVYLSWNRNAEEDIKGYKVYFSNAENHVFTQVTKEPDPLNSFTDSITLKTLTKNIWYKIAAVDENNNHSEFSETVKLRKPDIVPPMPPVAEKVFVDTAGVQIDFIHSDSEDAVAYLVYRKEGNNTWQPIETIKHDGNKRGFRFIDNKAKALVKYEYAVETIDEDSLHSAKSLSVSAIIRTLPPLPAITTLQARYDDRSKVAQLSWQYTGDGEYFFILYRGVDNGPLTRMQSVNKEELRFNDPAIEPGKRYRYAIQAIYKDSKGKTRLSDPVNMGS